MHRLVSVLLLAVSFSTWAQVRTEKEYKPVEEANYVFQYNETYRSLRHDFDPWKETIYNLHGEFYSVNKQFCRRDTITVTGRGKYGSLLQVDHFYLMQTSYGRPGLSEVTKDDWNSQMINTARYSPNYLNNYLLSHDSVWKWSNDKYSVTKLNMRGTEVEAYRRYKTDRIEKITATKHDDLYGDITTTYRYGRYVTKLGTTYPTEIIVERINGKLVDTVNVTGVERKTELDILLEMPETYKYEVEEEVPVKIEVSKYNDFIYFLDLWHTEDRVLVVEFKDYVLVAEAPLSPENGELIIAEVKKLIPNKPIKYFVFGHHHPHYLGGIRAFIHNETTILCRESNKEYVEFLAKAKHRIHPDSLQVHPKDLKLQIIKDELTLGKKKQMKIYFIGDKSAHTNDYLIYYFPKEKLLFQDDLSWIPGEGELKKAGERQEGLYNSIVDLGINVDTIIQSWPIGTDKVKTVFPFSELKQSVEMEEDD